MKETLKVIMQVIGGIFLISAIVAGAAIMVGTTQYEFRYNFRSIDLGTPSSDVVRVLGKPEGKVQDLVVTPYKGISENNSATSNMAHQAVVYFFWHQGGVTYYVGFDADDTTTMTLVRFPAGDVICQAKGRKKSKDKHCT